MFKAGDLFYINPDQGCLVQNDTLRLAYHKKTLEKNPEILNDWFEEIPEEYKRPRAELSKVYHYVNNYGGISADWEKGSLEDNYRYDSGNYSITGSGLGAYRDKLIAQQVIEDDAKGFKPEWGDEEQEKYYGYYAHRHNSLHSECDYVYQRQGVIYFKTEEDIEESFKKHRTEWLIVLGAQE